MEGMTDMKAAFFDPRDYIRKREREISYPVNYKPSDLDIDVKIAFICADSRLYTFLNLRINDPPLA